jgi:hypothetical protein
MTINTLMASARGIYAEIFLWKIQRFQGELGHHGLKTVLLKLEKLLSHRHI